jgi:hypothetical protein
VRAFDKRPAFYADRARREGLTRANASH